MGLLLWVLGFLPKSLVGFVFFVLIVVMLDAATKNVTAEKENLGRKKKVKLDDKGLKVGAARKSKKKKRVDFVDDAVVRKANDVEVPKNFIKDVESCELMSEKVGFLANFSEEKLIVDRGEDRKTLEDVDDGKIVMEVHQYEDSQVMISGEKSPRIDDYCRVVEGGVSVTSVLEEGQDWLISMDDNVSVAECRDSAGDRVTNNAESSEKGMDMKGLKFINDDFLIDEIERDSVADKRLAKNSEGFEEELDREVFDVVQIDQSNVELVSDNVADAQVEKWVVVDDDDWEGVERSDLEKVFAEAVNYVEYGRKAKNDQLASLSNDVQMLLYGFHQLAVEGPCQAPPPMVLKVTARAKWNAWQSMGRMSPEVAMEEYIKILSDADPGWMKHCIAEGITRDSLEAQAEDGAGSKLRIKIKKA